MHLENRISSDDDPPNPGQRRRQIVVAAAALFSERGYHGTSMQDIAARVGLLKGSLYAHVASKEELLLEILSTAARAFAAALDGAVSGSGSAADRLRLALLGHMQVFAEQPDLATVYVREWGHLQGQPATWIREVRQRNQAGWRRLLETGVERDEFRADLDLDAATMLTISAADSALAWRDGAGGIDATIIAGRYADLLLSAFGRAPSGIT